MSRFNVASVTQRGPSLLPYLIDTLKGSCHGDLLSLQYKTLPLAVFIVFGIFATLAPEPHKQQSLGMGMTRKATGSEFVFSTSVRFQRHLR